MVKKFFNIKIVLPGKLPLAGGPAQTPPYPEMFIC